MSVHSTPDDQFDPDAAALDTGGLFGLPDHGEPLIEVLPIRYEATTSYRQGTGQAPDAIIEASMQVDLTDARFGSVWQAGISLREPHPEIRPLGERAEALARPLIEQGGATERDASTVEQIDHITGQAMTLIGQSTEQSLTRGCVPALIGGEHALSLGSILAAARAHPGMGVLQIDAHLDLRDRYEGFEHSHASVMHNALEHSSDLAGITAVGIRDHGQRELERAQGDPRVRAFTDDALADDLARGRSFQDWCAEVIDTLPKLVYVSFDIDGLEPALCPSTGTPVPGGLTWHQTSVLLSTLASSDRKVVAFDLVEVGTDQEIDLIVGARLLYRLCGVVARQRGMA